jgi:hypothetical protein
MTDRWEAPNIKTEIQQLPVAIDVKHTMLAKSRTTGRRAENKASGRSTDLATTERDNSAYKETPKASNQDKPTRARPGECTRVNFIKL